MVAQYDIPTASPVASPTASPYGIASAGVPVSSAVLPDSSASLDPFGYQTPGLESFVKTPLSPVASSRFASSLPASTALPGSTVLGGSTVLAAPPPMPSSAGGTLLPTDRIKAETPVDSFAWSTSGLGMPTSSVSLPASSGYVTSVPVAPSSTPVITQDAGSVPYGNDPRDFGAIRRMWSDLSKAKEVSPELEKGPTLVRTGASLSPFQTSASPIPSDAGLNYGSMPVYKGSVGGTPTLPSPAYSSAPPVMVPPPPVSTMPPSATIIGAPAGGYTMPGTAGGYAMPGSTAGGYAMPGSPVGGYTMPGSLPTASVPGSKVLDPSRISVEGVTPSTMFTPGTMASTPYTPMTTPATNPFLSGPPPLAGSAFQMPMSAMSYEGVKETKEKDEEEGDEEDGAEDEDQEAVMWSQAVPDHVYGPKIKATTAHYLGGYATYDMPGTGSPQEELYMAVRRDERAPAYRIEPTWLDGNWYLTAPVDFKGIDKFAYGQYEYFNAVDDAVKQLDEQRALPPLPPPRHWKEQKGCPIA